LHENRRVNAKLKISVFFIVFVFFVAAGLGFALGQAIEAQESNRSCLALLYAIPCCVIGVLFSTYDSETKDILFCDFWLVPG
jgi:ABC-type sugar transport system permease subunit